MPTPSDVESQQKIYFEQIQRLLPLVRRQLVAHMQIVVVGHRNSA